MCSRIIAEKLRKSFTHLSLILLIMYTGQATAPMMPGKMNYVSFADAIMNKYRIVVEHWPFSDFISPGKINSVTDLELLYNSVRNGTTFFRRMPPAELDAWREQRYSRRNPTPVPATTALVFTPTAPTAIPANADGVDPAAPPAALKNATPGLGGLGPDTLASSAETSPGTAPLVADASAGDKRPGDDATADPNAPPAKKRKAPRKDKGIKRGPNKRTRACQEAEATASLAAAA